LKETGTSLNGGEEEIYVGNTCLEGQTPCRKTQGKKGNSTIKTFFEDAIPAIKGASTGENGGGSNNDEGIVGKWKMAFTRGWGDVTKENANSACEKNRMDVKGRDTVGAMQTKS